MAEGGAALVESEVHQGKKLFGSANAKSPNPSTVKRVLAVAKYNWVNIILQLQSGEY